MISEGIEVIEDGAPCHTSKKSCQYKLLNNNIHTIPWPPSSPDLNLFENVWALFKNKLRKQWRNPDKRPHNRQELIVAAQTAWDNLPWERVYGWFNGEGGAGRRFPVIYSALT